MFASAYPSAPTTPSVSGSRGVPPRPPRQPPAQTPPVIDHVTSNDTAFMDGGFRYAFAQQQQQQHPGFYATQTQSQVAYGREPEVNEATESYIHDINRFEALLTPDYDAEARRVEDEANASYMDELNQRMDRQLGQHITAQVADEDRRNSTFLDALRMPGGAGGHRDVGF